jgi:hypothetical protein
MLDVLETAVEKFVELMIRLEEDSDRQKEDSSDQKETDGSDTQ